jgi:hypothetical protein
MKRILAARVHDRSAPLYDRLEAPMGAVREKR